MKEDNYEDIINLAYHKSKKHIPMSMYTRAAQFAPFAALTGYDDAIDEEGRIVDERINIAEEIKAEINANLQIILEEIDKHPNIEITYFVPDSKKAGGVYKTVSDNVRRIDEVAKIIYLYNKMEININDIINISKRDV